MPHFYHLMSFFVRLTVKKYKNIKFTQAKTANSHLETIKYLTFYIILLIDQLLQLCLSYIWTLGDVMIVLLYVKAASFNRFNVILTGRSEHYNTHEPRLPLPWRRSLSTGVKTEL